MTSKCSNSDVAIPESAYVAGFVTYAFGYVKDSSADQKQQAVTPTYV